MPPAEYGTDWGFPPTEHASPTPSLVRYEALKQPPVYDHLLPQPRWNWSRWLILSMIVLAAGLALGWPYVNERFVRASRHPATPVPTPARAPEPVAPDREYFPVARVGGKPLNFMSSPVTMGNGTELKPLSDGSLIPIRFQDETTREPQRGVNREPRATPWVSQNKPRQALKERDRKSDALSGLTSPIRKTQGSALGCRVSAFQAGMFSSS